jgi:pyruvate carboxylase
MSETPTRPGKLMAANRGEIAIRIFRAANELGLRTVSIFAEEDRFSIHRFKADEAYQLDASKGPVGAYLDVEGIVALAKQKGVTMIHPGYGFLSENASFARACAREGIIFIGPSPDLLENMGDKTAARTLAHKFNVPTLPGTEEPITDPDQALTVAHEIGFPLIIKAAFGGGGRGMRVVEKPSQLAGLLAEAQGEAEKAFGNPAVFLERYISRAKHIEVQILGDQHGNVVHLYERDCSVQRRYQKVVEVAPAMHLDPKIRKELCDAAAALAKGIGYNNAGTVEFLYDMDQNDWFFIEMNPRIQVEHTVTECVTGIDLVRSQILIAQGKPMFSPEVAIPPQDEIPCNGFAIQCRVTTEDPQKGFAPDYGRILNYRSAAGFGIRLDAASGDAGSVVTPYYDSMLVKVTAMGRDFPTACQRMDRALREFRIRGVKTNIPFLENIIADETFRSGQAHTKLIDTKTELFQFRPRRDRATRTLSYLSDITLNGNPTAKGWKPAAAMPKANVPDSLVIEHHAEVPKGSRDILLEKGPDAFCKWILDEKRLLITDTTLRDAHQSLIATRMRTYDMLRVAEAMAHRVPELFSLEMWGGATFDTAMRFLSECPWDRLRKLREKIPNLCFQMLFRGSNAVGYSNYPDNVVAGFVKHSADSGMDMQVAMEAARDHGKVLCEAAICYTGDILDEKRDKYSLNYYITKAKEVEKMGAHILAIKDMAGLCKPQAAYNLVHALKQEIGIPIHFHTHDTSGLNAASVIAAAKAGVDIVDLAIASMSGSTSQPNLNSVSAALANSDRDPGLDFDALNELSDYWEEVLGFYKPFDSAPRAGTAEVYEHEMPGGQYTNLREQANAMGLGHRWREIARTYAEVNQLFGDIVKVTPSSKVVGDMCMFLVTRGIKAADVTKLKPGSIDFPESVIDMLSGGLGQPDGGWPVEVQKAILGNKKATTKRPGELADPVDFDTVAADCIRQAQKHNIAYSASQLQDAVFSHLMYPQVHEDFLAFRSRYDDLSALPTPAFFYGLHIGEEIEIEIDPGKILIIKLISIGEADSNGRRALFYELNGMPRESVVADKSLASVSKATRIKGDSNNPAHAIAPMPGMVTEVAVSPGQLVKAGDKLVVLEAMKMLTTVSASTDGTIAEVLVKKNEQVDSDDLLVKLG